MSDTRATHTRGPGGVQASGGGTNPAITSLLGLPAGSVPKVVPPGFAAATLDDLIIHWPGTFDPTVGDGYAAPAGAIGVSAVSGIAWFHPLAGSPTNWIEMGDVWQLALRLPHITELVLKLPELAHGVPATGTVEFPVAVANNQTLTIGGITYEAMATALGFVPTGGTVVVVDCTACGSANDIAVAFGHAIDTQGTSTVAASGPVGAVLTLTAQTAGYTGNVPITGTIPAVFAGMVGGLDPVSDLAPVVSNLQVASAAMPFEAYYAGIGAKLLGLSPPDYNVWYTGLRYRVNEAFQIEGLLDTSLSAGTGYSQLLAYLRGGIIVVGSGVVAGGIGEASPGKLSLDLRTGVAWYYAARARVASRGHHGVAGIFVDDAEGRRIILGFHDYISSANFVLLDDAAATGQGFLDMGVPLDAFYHLFELWADGLGNNGNICGRIDGGPTLTRVMSTGGLNLAIRPGLIAENNDTSGVDAQVFADDLLFITTKQL
jgi:hypothetical protein